jgi:ABC-type transport system involved in multi-copper enzyme maturation permease subunit
MIWLTWRQLRTQSVLAAALLAAFAAYLLITGTQLRHSYTSDLASCQAQNSCFGLLNQLQDDYNGPQYLAEFLVLAAPALIGIFWGAPLIAAELEHGTHFMAWNQSVTRTRWLAARLGAAALASVLVAGVLSLLITWWAGPLDAIYGNRWGTRAFNARDITPLGYAAFAFALGVALGLLIRRTLPAMAATLAVFVVVQVLVTAGLRAHLMPASTSTTAINQATMSQGIRFDRSEAVTGPVRIDLPGPAGAWILSESPVLNRAGAVVPTSQVLTCWSQMLNQGASAGKGASPGFGSLGACLAPQDLHVDINYQAAARYWPMQWVETGVYTALAALLTGACFWRIRRLRG